jgi:aryl-alcohol dehydrogenase (NADP+)
MYQQRYWHDREFDTLDALKPIAQDAGISMATLAVAWVLANPTITSAIVGASRPEQLADSVAALDVELPDTVLARLDELTAEYRQGDAPR